MAYQIKFQGYTDIKTNIFFSQGTNIGNLENDLISNVSLDHFLNSQNMLCYYKEYYSSKEETIIYYKKFTRPIFNFHNIKMQAKFFIEEIKNCDVKYNNEMNIGEASSINGEFYNNFLYCSLFFLFPEIIYKNKDDAFHDYECDEIFLSCNFSNFVEKGNYSDPLSILNVKVNGFNKPIAVILADECSIIDAKNYKIAQKISLNHYMNCKNYFSPINSIQLNTPIKKCNGWRKFSNLIKEKT